MGLAYEIGTLVIERGVEEKTLVIELEMFVRLANATLAQGEELLALGERPHSHGPFFESNRHVSVRGRRRGFTYESRAQRNGGNGGIGILGELFEIPKCPCKFAGI